MEEPVCRDFIVPTLFAAALDDMRAKKITKKSRERRFRRPRRLRVRTAYLSLGTRWAQFLGRLSASSSRRRFVFSHILYPGDERLTRLALVKKLALVLAPFLRAASAAFRARRPATLKCIVVVRRGSKPLDQAVCRMGATTLCDAGGVRWILAAFFGLLQIRQQLGHQQHRQLMRRFRFAHQRRCC